MVSYSPGEGPDKSLLVVFLLLLRLLLQLAYLLPVLDDLGVGVRILQILPVTRPARFNLTANCDPTARKTCVTQRDIRVS